ncbi:fumarate hydratase, partial [bacterium]|nr:fumarate hydratase [bacterium]
MPDFSYQSPYPSGQDDTIYTLLSSEYISTIECNGRQILKIAPEGLTQLARHAMRNVAFLLRPSHNEMVAKILSDPEASPNDRGVAIALLRNAEIASEFELPICQDTGTATVIGWRGQNVWTEGRDEQNLSLGIFQTYQKENLRYSQTVPLTMYEEKNSGTNLPAQIDLYASDGDEYKFLFLAKGGGSANKTLLFQQTKALLNPSAMEEFLIRQMKTLGTSACPPYHLAVVIGGTSADACIKAVKMAGAGYYDALPIKGSEDGQAFRDPELEEKLLKAARECGIGAQFGGKYFAHDVRVIRLPRHGASCPVGIGVSCSAHRNIKAKINNQGIWLEELDRNPGRLIPEKYRGTHNEGVIMINLDRPMQEILSELTQYPVATRLALSGTLIVARDIAHAKFKEQLESGKGLPEYLKNYPVYYAGPAKTPPGKA